MPTKPRSFLPGTIHHIYNRGTQKMTLFHTAKDYERFLVRASEYREKYPIHILSYCIMPNHFHFLVQEPEEINPKGLQTLRVDPFSNISRFFHLLQTSYGKYFGSNYPEYSGRVFQGTFKSKLVDNDAYYLQLMAYIHDNPVRKKIVEQPQEWPYSSYLDLIGIRSDDITSHEMFSELSHREIYNAFAKNRNTEMEKLGKYIL